ncbi:MAG: hypothetical protein N2V75_00915 [Methanophagales archaeon]|nr:hypothetical protein [Methanophagales archaeon]
MKENKGVTGSVIQRSIVPKDISTILSVASVPSSDIGYQQPLKFAVTQLFGVATTDCLTDLEYDRALKITTEPEFWNRLEDFYHEFYGPPFDMFLHEWHHYFRRWHERYFKYLREEKVSLSDDVLVCQLGGVNINNVIIPWFPYQLPFPYLPPKKDFEHVTDKFLRRFEIKPDHFSLSLKIRTSALLVPTRVRVSLKEIYEYYVPFGQSPETESETLKNIIKQAKSIVVAPLVAGAMGSATLLSTGQYVLAIECALASGASTIILVATTSIADRILDHLSKKRGSMEE